MSQIMGIDAQISGQIKSQKGKSEGLIWDFVKKFLTKCEDEEWVSMRLLWLYMG